MDSQTTKQQRPQQERLRLPFEKRKQDIGQWSYDHRFGLCITLIAVMVVAVVFLSARIRTMSQDMQTAMFVDIEELREILEEEQKKNEELKRMTDPTDYEEVRNAVSNENAELNDNLRDDRGTDASQLYDEALKTQQRMEESRRRYEQGLHDNDDMLAEARNGQPGKEKENRASKIQGSVMVSFSLTDPIRYERKLVTPAYMCQGGGTVIVRITVSRSGDVESAVVDKAGSTSDNCMTAAAVEAALQSRFNTDGSAPAKHQGTITYIFIPQ